MASIEYRVMRPEDSDPVRELFYQYWRSEPVAMALHMDVPRECKRYVDYALAEGTINGISAVAVGRITGSIVGFMLCVITTRDNWDAWRYPPGDKDCQKLTLHHKISSRLFQGLNIFEMYGVDRIGEGIALAISNGYESTGIATKLCEKCLQLLRENGIPIYVGETFSYFARLISDKLGGDIVHEVKYDDYIADGTLDMPDNSPHKSMVLVVKRIDLEKTGKIFTSNSKL